MIPRYYVYMRNRYNDEAAPFYRGAEDGSWCRWEDVRHLIEKLRLYEVGFDRASSQAACRCINCGRRNMDCSCR